MNRSANICLLTYDAPHLKTAQVMLGLHNRGFRGLDLLLMPFQKRKEREVLFPHRPSQFHGPTPQKLARYNGGEVKPYDDWRNLTDKYAYFIVCGSNLIEPEFAERANIINVHSGLIPSVRGLDSFKWAILNKLPMGNTLHRIDGRADAGEVIFQLRTPVFDCDDLGSLAQRHYENEIWMLVNFDVVTKNKTKFDLPELEATMRMPKEVEHQMIEVFAEYKEVFGER